MDHRRILSSVLGDEALLLMKLKGISVPAKYFYLHYCLIFLDFTRFRDR